MGIGLHGGVNDRGGGGILAEGAADASAYVFQIGLRTAA